MCQILKKDQKFSPEYSLTKKTSHSLSTMLFKNKEIFFTTSRPELKPKSGIQSKTIEAYFSGHSCSYEPSTPESMRLDFQPRPHAAPLILKHQQNHSFYRVIFAG
jgi:hypothetical protein